MKGKNTKRIVFHEITKTAILNAIENPRTIDMDLVAAQQARRVLDRLVGYELSPLLWKKVKPSLSAGRVQSVAVRLIVEREEEIKNFVQTSAYRVTAQFMFKKDGLDYNIAAELPTRFDTEAEARKFVESCVKASYQVDNIEKKPASRYPAPPFTTSTLQQEAARKLGFRLPTPCALPSSSTNQVKSLICVPTPSTFRHLHLAWPKRKSLPITVKNM